MVFIGGLLERSIRFNHDGYGRLHNCRVVDGWSIAALPTPVNRTIVYLCYRSGRAHQAPGPASAPRTPDRARGAALPRPRRADADGSCSICFANATLPSESCRSRAPPGQNVSKHLGILHAAGMVSRTKDGTQVRYSISDPSVFELCDQSAAACAGSYRTSKRSSNRPKPSGSPRPVDTANGVPRALRRRRRHAMN